MLAFVVFFVAFVVTIVFVPHLPTPFNFLPAAFWIVTGILGGCALVRKEHRSVCACSDCCAFTYSAILMIVVAIIATVLWTLGHFSGVV
jgi:hypothetical protein